MLKKTIVLIFVNLICFSCINALDIAVGKDTGSGKAKIFAEQDFIIRDIKNNLTYCLNSGRTYELKAQNGSILLNNLKLGSYISFIHMSKGVRINGVTYYGNTKINLCSEKSFAVVEDIDIEKYLYGVLRCEMGAGWPLEAYKAQAVVARTYALRGINKHIKEGFNICSTVHCQVYKPIAGTDNTIKQAIEETYGEVVAYDDKLAETFFHACCGGSTSGVEYIWNDVDAKERAPYLTKVNCSYCAKSPHYRWERSASIVKIKAALKKLGHSLGDKQLKSVYVTSKDSSGRAKALEFVLKGKQIKVKTSQFRMALGPELLRSTKVRKISKEGNSFKFSGNGWGHGVGMCQWGAKGMAQEGYGYRTIIKKYYPGTKVTAFAEID